MPTAIAITALIFAFVIGSLKTAKPRTRAHTRPKDRFKASNIPTGT